MDLLRRDCSALVDHYLYAQVATFLGLGVPALVARFFDEHLALVLGGLALATMAVNTLIARMRWRRIASAWACDEAARHHATVSSDLRGDAGNHRLMSKPISERMPIRNTCHGDSPAAPVNRLRAAG
jgi:hypothetical protein